MKSEEQQAREWASAVLSMPGGHYDDNIIATAELVMEATEPLPMSRVGWDENEHLLAGATWEGGEEVVMIAPGFNYISCLNVSDGARNTYPRYELIPNGKRCRIVEAGED